MSRININELISLETTFRMQEKAAKRDEKKIDTKLELEWKMARKRQAEGKTSHAERHAERISELQRDSAKAQIQSNEAARLVTQVQDFRKTVERAQAMSQATKGMGRLEKQMDLSRLTQIMDEYKDKLGNMDIARGIFNDASSSSVQVGRRQEDVDRIMGQLSDEAGVNLRQNLESAGPVGATTAAKSQNILTEEQEAEAAERLKALRNAA
ncbi:MAG: Vacuolar-sorting protein SNF7 [Claussenomyces sp. TS43310]|nr:MAG: Vacuolar-sorting protein SNF7 [Claussenomyces sp. TS43310]